MSEKYIADTMEAIRVGVAVKREITKAKAEAERLRKEAIAADKHLSSFAKKSRDDARAHARRCQIVGEVFLDLTTDNPTMWTEFKDHLELALSAAPDADRALFSLVVLPKPMIATLVGEAIKSGETGKPSGAYDEQLIGERSDKQKATGNPEEQ